MTHIDDERLAAHVLDPAELTASEQAHLEQCDQCAREIEELGQLIPTEDETGPPIESAPERIWASIAADLASPSPQAVEGGGGPRPLTDESDPVTREGNERPKGRNWWAVGLVAALIGVLVGVVGTVAIRAAQTPAETSVAEVALEPLPGKTGSGQATLIRTPEGLRLQVSLSDISVNDADLEVWLINTDGESMRSLGLSSTTGGTYLVPTWLLSDDFRIVDVSVEPRDGNLAHSTDSEVRGTLP